MVGRLEKYEAIGKYEAKYDLVKKSLVFVDPP